MRFMCVFLGVVVVGHSVERWGTSLCVDTEKKEAKTTPHHALGPLHLVPVRLLFVAKVTREPKTAARKAQPPVAVAVVLARA
jgi:hypothetical protein